MSSKIKAVDIGTEEVTEEPKIVTEDKLVEEPVIEQPLVVEPQEVETSKSKTDEVEIKEIIEEANEKPKPSRKMVTCPDCGKQMLEKNFRYQHINVCGKVKQPKLRAKPIEEVIKEKREKAQPKPAEPKVVEPIQPEASPTCPRLLGTKKAVQ